MILLVQIIRCTVIHEDQTEEHHYHELLPDILLPFLQYTAASFAILKYSSDKAANMAEQDKPIWCRLISTEQWSVYMDLIADCSPSKHTSTINKILRNEKYIGDALLQKTYTTDFLNKTRVKNNGIVPQYYVEGNHEPIIPKNIFLKVQDELVRRITCVTANGRKCGFSSHHAFSQIVFCCECGENFRRTQWNNRGKKSVVWRCLTRLYPKKTKLTCHARTVKEDELKAACLSAFNGFWKERDVFQEQMERNIERLIAENNPHEEEKLRKREEELQQELISLAEFRKNYSHVVSELQKVREQRAELDNSRNRRNETVSRIRELREVIRSQSSELTEFDETLVRHWIRNSFRSSKRSFHMARLHDEPFFFLSYRTFFDCEIYCKFTTK